MSLSATFLQMATGLGRARELGLPAQHCIVIALCSGCGETYEHDAHEEPDEDGHIRSVMVCLNCQLETSSQIR